MRKNMPHTSHHAPEPLYTDMPLPEACDGLIG